MEKNNFEGIWIPRDLWFDKNISMIEKCILVAINDLTRDNEFVTNNEISQYVKCSKTTVVRAIRHFKELGYIDYSCDERTGQNRILKVNLDKITPKDMYTKNALFLNAYYQDER